MAGRHWIGIVVCLVGIMVMFVGGCGDKAKGPGVVSDIDRLQGTWVGAEHNRDGQWTFVISGTKIDANGPGPEGYFGTLKLNAEVEPKQADFVVEKCEYERYVGTTSLGIYKIEGDTFTMAANEPGATARPTVFKGNDSDTRLFSFTRQ